MLCEEGKEDRMTADRLDYVRRASVLSALANPSRLMMIDSLSSGEKTVGELASEVALSLSTVSRHLGILRSAGLVLDRRDGTRIYHRLAAPCVLEFFDCLEHVLEGCACGSGRTPCGSGPGGIRN